MINGRVLPWVEDSNSDGYPVWSNFSASQREVFIINYEGNIETSFDITPYNPLNTEDVSNLTNLILSYRQETNDCTTGEVDLWGDCFSISNTDSLNLSSSDLNGAIPENLNELVNLEFLDLSGNSFEDSIPTLQNLTSLKYLNLSENSFTGSIPDEIGSLINLEYLNLSKNAYTWGGIPIGGISGSIPDEIGNLENLSYLNLSQNNLSGSIPSSIGSLQNLDSLNLSINFQQDMLTPVSGIDSIPPEIGDLVNLRYLNLSSCFISTFPSEISNLQSLEELNLSSNRSLADIELVSIGSDSASSIFSTIFELTSLKHLKIETCYLEGIIPLGFSNLENLESLYLNANRLSGELPNDLWRLEDLEVLKIGSGEVMVFGGASNVKNSFYGAILDSTFSLLNLNHLDLSDNQFSGEIPNNFFSHPSLNIVRLNGNSFSGVIPNSVCDFINSGGDSLNIGFAALDENMFCAPYPACLELSCRVPYTLGHELEFNCVGDQDTANCNLNQYIGPVWYVSNEGSDENGNGSEGGPFASIQKGIELAMNGDTVLVEPGTYATNNAIYNKNIILGSRYLTTGDTSFISSTIINGEGEGCPLMIYGNVNDSCRVTGFSIQNGTSGCVYGQGGGIYVEGSNPRLDNLIIKNNRSTNFGGGMHIVSSPTIENIILKNNEADELGGGLYIAGGASPTMNNIQIIGNTAVHGGGIFISENAQAIMNNTLIVENYQSAENPNNTIFNFDGYGAIETNGSSIQLDGCTIAHNQSTGILLRNGSNLTLSNSIFWFNEPILLDNDILDTINISYSNIENGFEGLGNISSNPLFCRIDLQDYALATNSPCIGTGQNNRNMGALGVGCEQSNSHWNFSIGEPIIQLDGGDGELNPGESLSIEVEFCNNSETGHMFYPGVVLEADTNLVSIFPDHFWFYGMDANSCNIVTFNIVADSNIISDTSVAFTAFVEALNCENQPEYCIFGDTTSFYMQIAFQGALSSQSPQVPVEFTVHQNHPNPFNPITLIQYDLPNNGFVNITIYDMMGRLVKTLLNNSKFAGYNYVLWDATNDHDEPVSAGVYIYVIQFDDSIDTKKMILLK